MTGTNEGHLERDMCVPSKRGSGLLCAACRHGIAPMGQPGPLQSTTDRPKRETLKRGLYSRAVILLDEVLPYRALNPVDAATKLWRRVSGCPPLAGWARNTS